MFTQKMDMEWELHGVQGAECPKDKTALVRASLVTWLLEREDWKWMLHPLVATFPATVKSWGWGGEKCYVTNI